MKLFMNFLSDKLVEMTEKYTTVEIIDEEVIIK